MQGGDCLCHELAVNVGEQVVGMQRAVAGLGVGAASNDERSLPGRWLVIVAFFSELALVRLTSVGAMSRSKVTALQRLPRGTPGARR